MKLSVINNTDASENRIDHRLGLRPSNGPGLKNTTKPLKTELTLEPKPKEGKLELVA